MYRYVIAITVALIIVASPTISRPGASQAQETPKGDVAAGKELYMQHCKKCHAADGQGVARMYKLVKASIVALGSKEAQEKSDDFIRKSMTEGYKKMEPIRDPRQLTPDEIENILAFIRTLNQQASKE